MTPDQYVNDRLDEQAHKFSVEPPTHLDTELVRLIVVSVRRRVISIIGTSCR